MGEFFISSPTFEVVEKLGYELLKRNVLEELTNEIML